MAKSIQSKKIRKKTSSSKETVFPIDNPLYCTQCDTDLDSFWLSEKANDPKFVKKNHDNCKKIGKFKGEFCSKLFIISNDDIDSFIKD